MSEERRANPSSANALSIKVELQADCYAGVWGHAAAQPGRRRQGRSGVDPGDMQEGLNAASAIGDDRLQKMATGHVMPDKFTHGTSAQRVSWFKRGFDSGDPKSCDTFGGGARVLAPIRGASPLGLPDSLTRSPLRRLAPFVWLASLRSLAF